MSSLKISIDIPHLDAIEVPVTTEIFNTKMEKVDTLVVSGEARLDNLSPGFYLVRAVLPSGEISTVSVHITEEDTEVDALLKTSASPHEWLARQQLMGAYRRPAQRAVADENLKRSATSQKAWFCIWSFQEAGSSPDVPSPFPYLQPFRWQLERITDWSPYQYLEDDTPDLTAFDLTVPIGEDFRYRVLQIGGEELPWRMVVMPPLSGTGTSRVQVLFRPSHSGVRLDSGVAVKLVTQDLETESLSHSIESGDYYHSGSLASHVLDRAESLLAQKSSNPYGALVGGYYLLGSGDLEHLHSWPSNFAEGFEWLPDAAIIHAWQILLDKEIENKSVARDQLLNAARRGLPIFKQGLHYLLDGLESFSGLARSKGRKKQTDEEVESALKYLQGFTRAANWNQRLVTYYGKAPYQPSDVAVSGMPTEQLILAPNQFLQFQLPMNMSKSSPLNFRIEQPPIMLEGPTLVSPVKTSAKRAKR